MAIIILDLGNFTPHKNASFALQISQQAAQHFAQHIQQTNKGPKKDTDLELGHHIYGANFGICKDFIESRISANTKYIRWCSLYV